ncbi:Aflatoxin B1 aldehyde reductase member 3 [Lachnellula cervina]|uniref:Aflatoxin B1 aldehyde reductase member 3 n=1 Tax=Lachnellula cervina TaxID=1316786 RepID=A0A7D8UKQ2_9HELO|nr:Aflatoxin B1 aldehyde reductase member 3 [Lachnellula cervina]
MAQSPKTSVDIVFGAMTLGKQGVEQARVHSLEECASLIDVFQKYGHSEIDTAIVYGGGSSEQYLGQLHWQDRGIIMDTKFSPRANIGLGPDVKTTHSPDHLRLALKRSLESLKTDKVDMWYLHAPDRSTPYETTLREVNNLHLEGYFRRFGISNYASWEVAQICEICERNGWVKPVVYQGVYNALHRGVEPELFPCLRTGGYLTSRYTRDMQSAGVEVEEGSRFDPKSKQGQSYRSRYWHEEYFDALDILRPVAKKHGLSEAECALRWMTNHSQLKRVFGDAVIIGASKTEQLEENLINLEKGPLAEDVVKALDEGWETVRGVCAPYFH